MVVKEEVRIKDVLALWRETTWWLANRGFFNCETVEFAVWFFPELGNLLKFIKDMNLGNDDILPSPHKEDFYNLKFSVEAYEGETRPPETETDFGLD